VAVVSEPANVEVIEGIALCKDCAWHVVAGNAVDLASEHHEKTGHGTSASEYVRVTYGQGDA
jgi:hypothetical protein